MTDHSSFMALHSGFTVLPAPTDVRLILADTSADASWTRTDHSVLTEQEVNHAKEMTAEAAATWAAGRVVVRYVLGSALETDPAQVEIRLDAGGKPRVEGCEFSVTRAQKLVLVALADDPIGLDLEAEPEHEVAVEATRLLHAREQSELSALPADELAAGFVRVWARKEAFLKALNTGLARDPGIDYIGTGTSPQSPHPDIEIHDLREGIPAGYAAALALNR